MGGCGGVINLFALLVGVVRIQSRDFGRFSFLIGIFFIILKCLGGEGGGVGSENLFG